MGNRPNRKMANGKEVNRKRTYGKQAYRKMPNGKQVNRKRTNGKQANRKMDSWEASSMPTSNVPKAKVQTNYILSACFLSDYIWVP